MASEETTAHKSPDANICLGMSAEWDKETAKPTTTKAASSVTQSEPRGIAIRLNRYAQRQKAKVPYVFIFAAIGSIPSSPNKMV